MPVPQDFICNCINDKKKPDRWARKVCRQTDRQTTSEDRADAQLCQWNLVTEFCNIRQDPICLCFANSFHTRLGYLESLWRNLLKDDCYRPRDHPAVADRPEPGAPRAKEWKMGEDSYDLEYDASL